jgi:hypothetical protein|tara:strand:- start:4767 stop:5018 length:252 start_codon:yes stop_codon:yes gene_type:complete
MKKKGDCEKIDEHYIEFIKRVAEAETYNKIYYEKNKEKMRKYQRKYLQEIRMGIRTPKHRKGSKRYDSIKFIKFSEPYIMTFD